MSEQHEELRNKLNNIRVIRKTFESCSLEFLDEVIEKLTIVRDEVKEQHDKYEVEVSSKEEVRQKALKMLEDAGYPVPEELRNEFTINELLGIEAQKPKKRTKKNPDEKVKAKFAINDDDSWKIWAGGRGRAPKWYSEATHEQREIMALDADIYNEEMGLNTANEDK